MGDQTPFGSWLKEYRKSHDMTRASLAELVGCSPVTIHKIETGERRPSRQITELLMARLEIPPTERPRLIELARGAISLQPQAVSGTHAPGDLDDQFSHKQSPGEVIPNNLSVPLTPLVGREGTIAQVRSYLLQDKVRLLSLVGPPGVGKTRSALQAGLELLPYFQDGVFFVPLAATADSYLVPDAIARVLDLGEHGERAVISGLIEHLHDKKVLLLLDNFEQVVSAAPEVVELLEACPDLQIIVTSREILHVRGEQKYLVPPLSLPDLSRVPPPDALSLYSAITLFVNRAQAAKPDFALGGENAYAVAAICTLLGGIPLAIELAAARVSIQPPRALLARLSGQDSQGHMSVLSGGPRDLPMRQRSVREALDWSFALLDESEQKLFLRLGVFTGGYTLTAAEAVCNATGDLPVDIFGCMASLLNKSLIGRDEISTDETWPRFTMLETIRQYARERLDSSEEEELHRWHAEYFLALAETADPQLNSAEQKLWFDRLEAEHDNLRAALHWTLHHEQFELAARLVTSLRRFWDAHAHLTEARRWFNIVLGHVSALPPHLRASVLHGAGMFASMQGELERAAALLNEGLVLQRSLNDRAGAAHTLNELGLVEMDRGDLEHSITMLEECLHLWRALHNEVGIAGALSNLGLAELYRGGWERAGRLFSESLQIRQQLGDKRGIAIALGNMAEAARRQGDFNRARELFEEGLDLLKETGDAHSTAIYVGSLATIASDQGQPLRAAVLFGAEQALRKAIGFPLAPVDQEEYRQYVEQARSALNGAAFDSAWQEGYSMSLEQAVAYVGTLNTEA